MKKERGKILALIDLLGGDDNLDDDYCELKIDNLYLLNLLNQFNLKWSPPVIESIQDTHEPIPIPQEWYNVKMSQGLPNKPLKLRTEDLTYSGVLFWEDDGVIYVVPNFWYNRIGNRTIVYWAY